ncbi:MAG: hypothetical protein IJ584_12145 [Bacteroidales bacterium]|nr:hypothetical protein [Bacteroidales bacterium]
MAGNSPRKKILFSLLMLTVALLSSCSKGGERADYILSWKGDGLGVEVSVRTLSDTLRFSYATENGGVKDQLKWFQDFSVSEGVGKMDSLSRVISFVPEKGKVGFSYTVRCTLPEGYGSPRGCIMDVFRPDIDSSMLFSRTENIFAVPVDKMDMAVSVRWESVPPYPVFSMYNAGRGTEPFDGKAEDIFSSVMAGDPLLEVDTVMVEGRENYLVTALRKNPSLNKEQLKDYFRTFYSTATRFWKDGDTSPYTMLFFPFRNNTWEATGNGFSNGFMSRYDATADTVLNVSRRDLFTHEIGHKWIGNGPAWFSEGFNEMQTAYLLVSSGITEPSYFATYFGNALSGLWHSPHRNVSGAEAEEKFWEDGQYIWLQYWRGFCYAFHLAGVYERETGNPNAWKAMMDSLRPLIHDFSEEGFLSAMASLMGRERLERDYRKYILEGKDFDFFEKDLPSGCTIERSPDGEPLFEITDEAAFAEHFR